MNTPPFGKGSARLIAARDIHLRTGAPAVGCGIVDARFALLSAACYEHTTVEQQAHPGTEHVMAGFRNQASCHARIRGIEDRCVGPTQIGAKARG